MDAYTLSVPLLSATRADSKGTFCIPFQDVGGICDQFCTWIRGIFYLLANQVDPSRTKLTKPPLAQLVWNMDYKCIMLDCSKETDGLNSILIHLAQVHCI